MHRKRREMQFVIWITSICNSIVEGKVACHEMYSEFDTKKYSEYRILNLDVRIPRISMDHFFHG